MTGSDATTPEAAARAYASRGWLVFPCHSVGEHGCSCRQPDCGSPGKHPRIASGLRAASADPETIARWWARWRHANVAVRTGAESNLVVIDIDPQHGGAASMRTLVGRHEPLSRGPVVRTGSGGWHLLFGHPGEPLRNSAGKLGPGIDVRGDGGYVIAPPSRHASGRLYRWDVALGDLPELPGWLRDQMETPRHAERQRPTEPIRIDEALSAWARAALEGEAMEVRSAPQGSRNATLNRAAFCLGQIVGARVLDASLVERVLGESAITSGLGEREALLTIRSGLRAGMDHPRGPRERAQPSLPPTVRPSPSSDAGLDVADML